MWRIAKAIVGSPESLFPPRAFFLHIFSHLSHRTDGTHTLLSSPTHLSAQAQLLLCFIRVIKSVLPFVMYKHSLATLLGTVVQLLVNTNIISCHLDAS